MIDQVSLLLFNLLMVYFIYVFIYCSWKLWFLEFRWHVFSDQYTYISHLIELTIVECMYMLLIWQLLEYKKKKASPSNGCLQLLFQMLLLGKASSQRKKLLRYEEKWEQLLLNFVSSQQFIVLCRSRYKMSFYQPQRQQMSFTTSCYLGQIQ